MKICLVSDDNSGITKSELAKYPNLKLIRMPIIVDGEVYFENENLTQDDFYKKLENDQDVTTSQPSPGEVINFWDELLKEYDHVIHMPMSSGLSESCHSAMMLAEDYKGKVTVVDNHRISVVLKAAIQEALKLIDEGKTPEEIKDYLEGTKQNCSIYVMVDTLKYLKKGGRVTAAGAALGATFHIKPILTINGGKLDAYTKCSGVKRSKKIMINAIKNDLDTKYKDVAKENLQFAIAYTYDLEAANEFKAEVEEALGVKVEIVDPLSISVAAHIGPGCLAVTCSVVR